MPQFTRDIQPVGSVNPGITQPVQDNTLAQGIANFADLGITAAKKIQEGRGRELGQQFTSELVTTAMAPETGSQLTQGDFVGESAEANKAFETARREGKKLGKAKAALGEGAFKVRAEASLKNLMASHPFFSDEIARGFAAETGFDPRGATVAEAFQLMRERGSAQDDYLDQMRQFATRFNISTLDPEWIPKVNNRLQREQQRDQYKFLKDTQEYNTSVETNALTYDADIVTMFPDLLGAVGLPPGASMEEVNSFIEGASGQEIDQVKDNIRAVFANKVNQLKGTYRNLRVNDSDKFNSVIESFEQEMGMLFEALDNGEIAEFVAAENKIREENLKNDYLQDPVLGPGVVLLNMVPPEASAGLANIVGLNKAASRLFPKVSSNNTTVLDADPEAKKEYVNVANFMVNSDPESSLNSPARFRAFANVSNIARQVSADPSAGNQQALARLYAGVSSPNIVKWMGSDRIPQEEKEIVRENFLESQYNYLPKVVQNLSEKVAKIPGASIEVSSLGTFRVSGSNSSEARDVNNSGSMRTLNNAVKGLSHVLTGNTSSSGYKAQAEILLQSISAKEEEARKEVRKPIQKEAERIEEIPEPNPRAKQAKEKRKQELEEEYKRITGEELTLSDEELLDFRVAAVMREVGDVFTEEEIRQRLS